MWHVLGRGEVHAGFRRGDPRETDNLEDTGLDGRIILKWIFKNWDGKTWTGLMWVRIKTGGGRFCECGDAPSGSINCG